MAVQRDKVIANAEKLVAKGKIEPAIKEYERLLEDSPNDVNTLNRIGDLWVRVNRNDEAVKVFGKIADHYSRDGFFLKAIAIYKKINKLDPSKLDIYAKLADLYAKQGLAMEAKSQYQVLADYYLKHGEPSSALGIYRKISELDPSSINVHVKLADLYSQNNQVAEALKEYDRVGRLLLKRGMLDEAVQVFRKALKIDPKNTDMVDSLVTAMLESKELTNAQQVVDAALEVNPNNPRLLSILGRIQLQRGDGNAARATLERAVGADPNDTASREAMADLYLKQHDATRALEMLAPLVERALGKGERANAIELINRILRVESGHTPTLERLVAVYQRLNEETNILGAMSSLAEAHVSRMRFDEAAKVLEKLIQREPQNAQHRNKLQFVRSQMGGLDTVPARSGRPATVELPMEIEEPSPSFDLSDDSGSSFSLDLDSGGPALDLGSTVEPSRPTPPAPAPPPPVAVTPTHLVPAVELVAETLEGGDDLDFITEHLTEAEVFQKYGLAEKAAEHLRAVLERSPTNLTAHERLFRILLEEGDVAGARTAAQAYADVLDERGESAQITAIKNEFLARGERFELAPPPPPSFQSESSISLEEFAAGDDEEMSFDLDGSTELEFDLDEPEVAAVPAPEPTPAFVPEPEPQPEPQPEFGFDTSEPEPEPAVSYAAPESEPAAPVEMSSWDMPSEPTFDSEVEPEIEGELSFDGGTAEPAFELPAEEEISFDTVSPVEELQFTEEAAPETADTLSSDFSLDALSPVEERSSIDALSPVDSLSSVEMLSPVEELSLDSTDIASDVSDMSMEEPFFGVEALAEIPNEPIDVPMLEPLGVSMLDELPEPEALPTEVPLAQAPVVEALPLEEIGEVDFYIEQELFDEARRKLETLQARFPDNVDLAMRADRLASASAAATAAAAAAAAPRQPIFSRDLIETELLSAIPDDDDEFLLEAPAPAPPPAAPAVSASLVQEENLFADEDNFFDLAAELESELADEEESISLSEEEQSLEEIFREFKKGVEQQLDSEDYDTHYNLGIAYKEMGLIDEAIGEFQLASKDPKRAVECASMLGLCFLEKGMPQLAIKWYRKGLEMPEITEEEHVGLLYDLASAYQEVGDTENAQKSFMEVYGMNSNYRDIVSRIKQLEDARR